MTDDELQEAIAVLRGWIKLPWPAVPSLQKPSENGVITYVPNWPKDICAAWELWEELIEAHFSVKLLQFDYSPMCYVIMHHRQGHDEGIPDNEFSGVNASRAICNAWLDWKENG
jgi:hypothetical protein